VDPVHQSVLKQVSMPTCLMLPAPVNGAELLSLEAATQAVEAADTLAGMPIATGVTCGNLGNENAARVGSQTADEAI
jgi:hypothetical protein